MSTLQEDIMFIAGLAVIVIMANAMKDIFTGVFALEVVDCSFNTA